MEIPTLSGVQAGPITKILTIIGTRPELIRLSVIIKKLDYIFGPNHILVWTNQNYDRNLSGIFFSELGIKAPDYILHADAREGTIAFIAEAFKEFEIILNSEKPDKVLILGDTNSSLLAIVAAKLGFPVYHMEAGNRCFNTETPEEINRRMIDSVSHVNLPYTQNSMDNLLREGYHRNSVFKIGNPLSEVLGNFHKEINASQVLDIVKVSPKDYVLLSLHRSENVDNCSRLEEIISAINFIASSTKVVFSVHPRTKSKIDKYGISLSSNIICIEPVGLFDFVKLERSARLIMSDSGSVPEEGAIFGVPTIILRKTCERQELLDCGSVILAGVEFTDIINAFRVSMKIKQTSWSLPMDYCNNFVSDTVIKILSGH
jgi:UDP-N-acetylglucosamine 2-epimerase (non-hydrolysing)